MTKLEIFYDKLLKYDKKPDEFDSRPTWCHILTRHKGELHRFEVRWAKYWSDVQENSLDVIHINVVNWTLCAGTATLTLSNDNVGQFVIEEEEPTIGLLYVK